LDAAGRVIYLGTFSKTLFPSLRLGFVVLPPELVDPFRRARSVVDGHSPVSEQAVLDEFIADGHFARHIRRMRVRYGERQAGRAPLPIAAPVSSSATPPSRPRRSATACAGSRRRWTRKFFVWRTTWGRENCSARHSLNVANI